MAKYSLEIKKSAAKELKIIPHKYRLLIIEKIQNLAKNPFPPQSQKLTDKDQYRLRIGKYRILYEVKKDKLVIVVIKIAHRKDAYK